ncbi:MAG: helix-turn-helix domain-containing protein [Gammaproteobacteria bacterium]|nr:helix-turn-helix domain-containing protein [Gammaproteobacteria bacterium]
MTAVWDHFPGSGTQLLTMLKLADYADDAGENVFPSVATIAKYVRSTKRQVQRIMHGLIADNWIEVVAHANGGRGRAREYRLRIDRLNVPEKDDTNVTLSPIKGDAHVALSTKRVTSKVKKGDTHVTPSIKNQKIKHIRRQPEGVATSSIPEIHTCPAEQIVALYHEILPELPKVKVLTDKRRKHLRARWCSDCSTRISTGGGNSSMRCTPVTG